MDYAAEIERIRKRLLEEEANGFTVDALAQAQAHDARRAGIDSVSDAIASAFMRKPVAPPKPMPSEVEKLAQRGALADQGRARAAERMKLLQDAQADADDDNPQSEKMQLARKVWAENGINLREGLTYRQLKGLRPDLDLYVEAGKERARRSAEEAKKTEEQAELLQLRSYAAKRHPDKAAMLEGQSLGNTKMMLQDWESAANAATAAGQRAGIQTENKVEKLSETVPREVAALVTQLEQLEKEVGDFDPSNKAPIPGTGPVEGRLNKLPLVGQWFASDEAKRVDQTARGIVAALVKLQSGQTVSPKELDSKMIELGMVQDAGPQQYRRGLANLRAMLAAELKVKRAGYDPEVQRIYDERGGLSPRHVESIGQKQKRPQSPAPSPGGKREPVGQRKVPGGVEVKYSDGSTEILKLK